MGNTELIAFSSKHSSSVSTGCSNCRHVGSERPAGTDSCMSGLTECFKIKLNWSSCKVVPRRPGGLQLQQLCCVCIEGPQIVG